MGEDVDSKLAEGWARNRKFMISYVCVGAVIGILTPNSISTDPWIVEHFVDPIASIIPAANGYARVSRWPELTRFYFVTMWLLLPFWAILMAIGMPIKKNVTWKILFKYLFLGPVAIVAIGICLAFISLPQDFEHSASGKALLLKVALTTRVGLGVLASMAFMTEMVFIAAWLKFCSVVVVRAVSLSR